MLKILSRAKEASTKPLEINHDYYREESCPIDGKVHSEGKVGLIKSSFAEVKEAILKCLFDSTDGVITKQDWLWMLGIGCVGAIAFSTARLLWVNASEITPAHPQELPAMIQGDRK